MDLPKEQTETQRSVRLTGGRCVPYTLERTRTQNGKKPNMVAAHKFCNVLCTGTFCLFSVLLLRESTRTYKHHFLQMHRTSFLTNMFPYIYQGTEL